MDPKLTLLLFVGAINAVAGDVEVLKAALNTINSIAACATSEAYDDADLGKCQSMLLDLLFSKSMFRSHRQRRFTVLQPVDGEYVAFDP